jgi:predicted DsbA family dithiol-disulfide isomerase
MSFEIHPDIPAGGVETISYLESLGYSDVLHVYNRIRQRGLEAGITIGSVPRKYNTHLSLLLTEYAKEQNKLLEYNEAVFKAFWTDGSDISEPAVLEQIMAVIGLDFNAALLGVKSGEYERRFEDAKALSRKLGITAVPAFIIDDKYLISGAQPVEVFRQVFRETSSSPGGSGPSAD